MLSASIHHYNDEIFNEGDDFWRSKLTRAGRQSLTGTEARPTIGSSPPPRSQAPAGEPEEFVIEFTK